jgi:hypothetical protein
MLCPLPSADTQHRRQSERDRGDETAHDKIAG